MEEAHIVVLGLRGVGMEVVRQLSRVQTARLTLVDDRVVEVADINRNFLHATHDFILATIEFVIFTKRDAPPLRPARHKCDQRTYAPRDRRITLGRVERCKAWKKSKESSRVEK